MPFAGFDMPVQYSGITDEHLAVRNAVGVFDVSHMGEFRATGPGATAFVQNLVSNDVERLFDGRAMYSVMCHEDGGIVDDLLVYRIAEDDYLLVVNAANIQKDFEWASSHLSDEADLVDVSDDWALIAVQGPRSTEVVQELTKSDLDALKFYHFVWSGPDDRLPAGSVVSRTGYTGELGYELYVPAEDAKSVWDAVFEAGEHIPVKPAGLGARDTLRLESGFCLYGNDITDDTNPFEAGLGWVTKLDKGGFVGSEALAAIKEVGTTRKLVGFAMKDRGIPRAGYPLVDAAGESVGVVTSGTQSPILECGIGLGYVAKRDDLTTPGSEVFVEVRGRKLKAEIRKPPLHK